MTKYLVQLTHVVTHDFSGGSSRPLPIDRPPQVRRFAKFYITAQCHVYANVDEAGATRFDSLSMAEVACLANGLRPHEYKIHLIDEP
jgi:hypothetical protein